MQYFSQEIHQCIKQYFHIQENPSVNDTYAIEITKKYIRYIRWIPGLQMIAIGNSVAMFASTEESDIDLFIITTPKSMWLVRIIITAIFQLLGVRKTQTKHAHRFCLSFFCTTNGMDFGNFALKNDPYLYFWIVYLKPILNFNGTYEAFISSQNWANFDEYKEQIQQNTAFISYAGKKETKFQSLYIFLNTFFKKIFLPKTLKHFERFGKPYGIVIQEDILKFHDNDIRKEVAEKIYTQEKKVHSSPTAS